jgi:1-deoxy-D-xylulose-5-phosphate reductoisomerase
MSFDSPQSTATPTNSLLLASAFHTFPAGARKYLSILGSTGSIGTQTLEVVTRHPEQLTVVALGAHQNMKLLAQQIQQVQPKYVSVANATAKETLLALLAQQGVTFPLTILCNDTEQGLQQLACLNEVTHVVVGVVGMVGLAPTLAAVKAHKLVMTANKETFVAGGALMQPYLNQILPLDSEHSSLFQCLHGANLNEVQRLWLTASGGPFLHRPAETLAQVSVADALKHPKWTMGQRISIDSATLMNKGFEVIEAHWQFGLKPDKIQVVIHPQSTVHGLVEWVDGTFTSHLGPTDMRLPLQYGLSYPERWPSPLISPFASHLAASQPPQLADSYNTARALGDLTFLPLDPLHTLDSGDIAQFPCFRLAMEALKAGSAYTCALNAADEVAVNAFLQEKIRFTAIAESVEYTLNALTTSNEATPIASVADAERVHAWAMETAERYITTNTKRTYP